MKFFLLSVLTLLQILSAQKQNSDISSDAQFWHPDSFHAAYYLPGNFDKAVIAKDTMGIKLIRGTQYLNLKDYQKAIQLFKSVEKELPKLKPYLQIRMAQALSQQGSFKQADSILAKASKMIQSGPGLDYLIQVWFDMKVLDSSYIPNIKEIDSLMLTRFKVKRSDRWSIESHLFDYMSESQKADVFVRGISSNKNEIQKTIRPWLSKNKVIQNLVKKDTKLKVKILEYDAARQPKVFFKTLAKWNNKKAQTSWDKNQIARIEQLKAKAYYGVSDFKNAAKYYQKLVNMKSQPLSLFYLQLARSYKKNKQLAKSNKYYSEFKVKFPKHTKTAEMIWTAATKNESAGNIQGAETLYRKIDKELKDDKRNKWAVFKVAMMYYKKGQWQKAADTFEDVYKKRRGLWSANGAYMLRADALYKLGRKKEAKAEFIRAINDFPLSYYAHLSRKYLKTYGLMDLKNIPTITPLIMTDDEAGQWMRTKTDAKTSDDKWSPVYQETFERLLQMGEWEAADFVYASSPKNLRWRLDFVLKYSRLYLKHGYLAQSYRLARRVIRKISRKYLDKAPMQFYDVAFPRPHLAWIKNQTDQSPVDPSFVLALMRQESIFDDQIASPVGARGLMQIMPYTGVPLAKREGLAKVYNHDLLRNPLMAIRLGTRYLKDLHKDWKGGYEYMLANYNAGPKPTKRWFKANKGLDEKIAFEQITYWETRNYIKKVMGNYWNYQILENYRTAPEVKMPTKNKADIETQSISAVPIKMKTKLEIKEKAKSAQ